SSVELICFVFFKRIVKAILFFYLFERELIGQQQLLLLLLKRELYNLIIFQSMAAAVGGVQTEKILCR
ncbi:MAG: hypothetical protein Q8S01_04110, partial [Ignavibacteria bacterium]|nr:hypothetical protein [Ignavibacteria bacterium]